MALEQVRHVIIAIDVKIVAFWIFALRAIFRNGLSMDNEGCVYRVRKRPISNAYFICLYLHYNNASLCKFTQK